ncbi:hypothetical protein SAMN05216503_0251 [Polaribacter sp. KT25b]|uniref:hypothetical protein n=1 Tax=Polaribacter sp. KT25b TaxID=1855336 RepID=UPI000879ADD9|nr:hypothetical protein [Polaribacter sp. KT25b]SDR67209.1 hypothetical protein SAMN05216503_0251 [Polaribacter sp. KT25b]
MKNNLFTHLYGSITILGGFFLIFSKYFTFENIKFSLGLSLITGAILALVTAFYRKRKQVEFTYHEMHALAMMVYGASVLLFCKNIETLINFTSFLFLFYTLSEIIFCSWLFNLDRKVSYKIIFIRLLLALIVGFGVVILEYSPEINKEINIEGFGLLFIIIGINIFLYAPVMRNKNLNKVDN